MNRMISRRGMAALGIGMAIAMSAGIHASSAQPGPRVLPSSPQYQDQATEQQDQQFGPADRGYGPADRGDNRFARPGERLERRLAYLHTQLRITPAQERGWQILANVLRDEARDLVRERRDYIRAPSVLDRLEERHQMLTERSADLERVMRALRPLYASFSAEQKRTADQLMFRPEGGRGFGGRFGGGQAGGRGFEFGGPPDRFDRDDRPDRDYRPGDYR